MLHENVTADIAKLRRHVAAIVRQRLGDIEVAVDRAEGLGSVRVPHQPDRLARNAEADGDFRADRDKLEVIAEDLAAQLRSFVAAVEAHIKSQ
ncbi:hypothetical protein D3C76_1082020 [compost metagenome]